ncbi:MAG: phenylalanine--tRNA ligase subunit beta [Phycisphaerales bacterium]|nr:phenylalanine--tRNA ligase subunit beta [Phycisphaerales bacterium]
MPVINMPLDLLLRLVNADRSVIDESRVPQTLHDMGIELDELTSTTAFTCRVCSNVMDRTEAQGEPLHCAKCGVEFRDRPDALVKSGSHRVARLDMLAVRPDIFDAGGMARYMRGFLGIRTGLIDYPVLPAKLSVRVDPRLSRDASYRPAIACAVLRNVRFDDERIKLLMNLQEDLHWALGRDRKLASIGVYDLDKVNAAGAAPFAYRAVGPDELRFVPLGYAEGDAGASMTPREVLQKHKTGRAYAHLLAKFSEYPLLTDADGKVMSMPPIINSEATRVTLATRQCFVDVTGLAQRTVDRALNILVAGLKEVMPELQIEGVKVEYERGPVVTPNFATTEMALDASLASDTIGIQLSVGELSGLLERMGHGVTANGAELRVRVPAWRNDILHPIDLIEDAAVALGYEKLSPVILPAYAPGRPRALEERSAVARRVMVGLGFHQVMTLVLLNEDAAFSRWNLPVDPCAVRIEHPISSEQTIARVSLLPGLLHTLSINKQYELPQRIFEVGDVSFADAGVETGAREQRRVAAASMLLLASSSFFLVRASTSPNLPNA